MRLVCLPLAAVALAGASASPAAAETAPVVRVTISAKTHNPRANEPWPVTIRVSDARGKPLSARLTMRVLLGPFEVGKVENGRIYRIVGVWREPKGEEITWPAASRGRALTFQAVVTARGRTVRKNWTINVR